MDIGIIVKIAGDVMADEPAIVTDIAVVEAALAKAKALPKPQSAVDFVQYAKIATETLEAVAPLLDQIIAQVKALKIPPAAAPGQ